MEPKQEWSEAERFVWDKICAGEQADFNSREGKKLDPNSPYYPKFPDFCWYNSRRISSEFLETILFEKPFRETVTRKGVRIVGAYFPEKIDLEDGHLPWSLGLQHSRFENGLNMSGLQTERQVSLEGSVVKGELGLGAALIGNALFMRRATFEKVMLRGAQIKGQLAMIGATVTDTLDMASISTGDALLMRGATFEEVHLQGAQIKGQLDMDSARVKGKLDMDSVSIDGALLMRGATFEEVHLGGAQIKDQLAITGARVKGKLNMDSVSIGSHLFMTGATFKEVNLRGAEVKGQLTMSGTTVTDTLDMASISIGRDLLMKSFKEDGDTFKATFGKILLRGAQIKGQLAMIGTTVKGTLDMGSVSVGGALLMGSFEEDGDTFKTTFGKILLRGAQIKGQLAMIGTTVKGTLDMGSVSVGGALLMRATVFEEAIRKAQIKSQLMRYATLMRATVFEEVILRGAQIKGQLAMRDATVRGKLDMTSALIGNSLLMDGATFANVNLGFATVGSILDLTGGTFKTLDLTGVTVEGELRLITEGKSVKWQSDNEIQSNEIQFNLQNTQVDTLVDNPESWPAKIELEGFTYRQLGGVNMYERPARDFIEWLDRDKTFSFQPYQQLTAVLRNADKSGTADKVLFAGKERERHNAKGWEYLWLSVLRYSTGYLISRYIACPVFVLGLIFTLIGWGVLCIWEADRKHVWTLQEPIGFWFSLDYLLPVIQLREAHYTKVDLSYGVRIYFYVHQIIGYALVSFFIAVFSGITKPISWRGPPE